MQRLSERKSCMLGLVVFEIQVVPWQRGNLLVSYYTLQIKYNIQASGQLPKWTVIWLEFMNQVKDFKTLKVNTFRLYPPSTRTPFIWVRCIFFNKERESATSIFLQPSRSKICCAKNTKYSGHWIHGHINYAGKSPLVFCCQRECKECLRLFKLLLRSERGNLLFPPPASKWNTHNKKNKNKKPQKPTTKPTIKATSIKKNQILYKDIIVINWDPLPMSLS